MLFVNKARERNLITAKVKVRDVTDGLYKTPLLVCTCYQVTVFTHKKTSFALQ